MKLPIKWLKKYINVDLGAQELADRLTLSGTAVERVESLNGENILDIEVTTNRPDCLSILGLAYEVSALTQKKVQSPEIDQAIEKSLDSSWTIRVSDSKACPYYSVRYFDSVEVKPSDVDSQILLSLCDCKSISNVVDVTNFVLFETGQPLHAFDADKIEGKTIEVRFAKKGEKIIALDAVEYELDEKTLVIADAVKAIAIAGVIGGKATEVNASTKNVLLEAAYFDPVLIRTAARKYKISTESSYRFERNVNAWDTHKASKRAAYLLRERAQARLQGLHEISSLSDSSQNIKVDIKWINQFLGLSLNKDRMMGILNNLSFETKDVDGGHFQVKTMPYRKDVQTQVDVAEEILRIEGFDKTPVSIPMTRHQDMRALEAPSEAQWDLKKFMAAQGFSEVLTYSLLSEKALKDSAVSVVTAQKIINAVSAEQEYLRPNLMTGVLSAVAYNVHRKASALKFFEVGHVYAKQRESVHLAAALYGPWESNWRRKSSGSVYELKGILESVFSFFRTQLPAMGNIHSSDSFEACMDIGDIGLIGNISAKVLKAWNIPGPVYFLEIRLDKLLEARSQDSRRFEPPAKYPAVHRDIALILDESHRASEILDVIKKATQPYLSATGIFDEFKGKNIPKGKRSLAFWLEYQKPDGTFTDAEIQKLQDKVIQTLQDTFAAQIRS